MGRERNDREGDLELVLGSLAGDEEDVLAALNRGRAAQGLEQRSRELWRWRAAAPDGAVLGLARSGADVRAVLVGVRHCVRLEGVLVPWIEVVDVFNDFTAGSGLARTRALLDLADAFAREHGGTAPEKANVLYGIPTRRAHRIGRARFKQEILRSENALSVRPSSVVWTGNGFDVVEVERFGDEVEGLFRRYAEHRPAMLVRDAERLDWRYADHPERDYRIALARRRGGELVGYAVLRIGEYAGLTGGVLADWMVLPEEAGAGMELLVWAGEVAREHDRLVLNVPDKSPEFALFQAVGFQVSGTDEYLVFRGFQKPYVMSWLFAHWTYTLGDSERG